MSWNLRAKLMGSYLLLVLFMTGLGVVALQEMKQIQSNLLTIGTHLLPSVHIVGDVDTAIHNYRRQEYRHILIPTEAGKREVERERIEGAATEVDALFDQYRQYVTDSEEQTLFDRIQASWQAYSATTPETLRLSYLGEVEAAAERLMTGEVEQAFTVMEGDINAWSDYNDRHAQQELDAARVSYQIAQRVMVGTILLLLLLALLLGFFLARSIANAVGTVARAAEQMALGDMEQHIEVKGNDELSDMAASFSRMVLYLREMVHAASVSAGGTIKVVSSRRKQHVARGSACIV